MKKYLLMKIQKTKLLVLEAFKKPKLKRENFKTC